MTLLTELNALEQMAQTMTEDLKQRTLDLYKTKLSEMDESQLANEFSDRIGNELGEFQWFIDHKGRKFVEWILADKWEVENG